MDVIFLDLGSHYKNCWNSNSNRTVVTLAELYRSMLYRSMLYRSMLYRSMLYRSMLYRSMH
jgi:hypothetical protein